MTNEEFYEIARQNNAIMSPEESERSRQETLAFFARYKINVDWLGSPYFIDTHNPIHVFVDECHTCACLTALFLYIFWGFVYIGLPLLFFLLVAIF
ncbi:MAG: hypothetical protein LBG58_04055 [Planctomycetaceae bacterium]|jgi:hypothetical protein|nr:hypothetical protein [Planctomycetaceae bacterium]